MTPKLPFSRAWTLPALVLIASCFSLDTDVALQIQQTVAATGEALPTLASASAGRRSVAISGRIVGRLPCDVIEGDIEESGTRLRITVTVVADRNHCPGRPPTTWSYVANVLAVESGQHAVVVEHRYQGVDGPAGVVLDTLLDVR